MSKDIEKLHDKIIDELKRVRLEKGYSHYKLAEMTGLHRTAIGHIENKIRKPSLVNCLKIAKALEIDFSKIISSLQK